MIRCRVCVYVRLHLACAVTSCSKSMDGIQSSPAATLRPIHVEGARAVQCVSMRSPSTGTYRFVRTCSNALSGSAFQWKVRGAGGTDPSLQCELQLPQVRIPLAGLLGDGVHKCRVPQGLHHGAWCKNGGFKFKFKSRMCSKARSCCCSSRSLGLHHTTQPLIPALMHIRDILTAVPPLFSTSASPPHIPTTAPQVTPYPLLLFGGTITVQLAAGSVAIDGWIRLACAPKVGQSEQKARRS